MEGGNSESAPDSEQLAARYVEIYRQDGRPGPLPLPPQPVFFDERQRRWPWVVRCLVTLGMAACTAAVLLVISLIALPLMPPTKLPRVAPVRDYGNADPPLSDYNQRKLDLAQRKEINRLKSLNVQRDIRRNQRHIQAEQFLTGMHLVQKPPAPVVAGFYVNWEQSANVSLHKNISSLTHVMPEWLHLRHAGYNYARSTDPPFEDGREKSDVADVTPLVRSNGVSIIPLINNYTHTKNAEPGVGNWDPAAVHQMIATPEHRALLVQGLLSWLLKEKMQGINIDFEQVQVQDTDNLVEFMKELYAALHPKGLLVTQDIELEVDGYDIPRLAQYNDWIVPMFYDQHSDGGPPGPIAGADWSKRQLDELLKTVPPEKVVMGVGNHAYDWLVGDPKHGAESIDFQKAMTLAKETTPESVVKMHPGDLNLYFTYTATPDEDDSITSPQKHDVWMLDAATIYNQLIAARPLNVRGAALWFVGSEDPSLWSFFSKQKWNDNWKKIVDGGALNSILYGGQGQVQFQGEGELLLPTTAPAEGLRTVRVSPTSGQITDEKYAVDPATGSYRYPEGWVVKRYGGGVDGNPQKQILLTFDDGPDPDWTPKILDILKQYQVPAVFFVVGKNAEEHPDLVRRMWDEGHEIGNHSWNHPDLFRLSPEHQRLELTTTERIIQSITGHSTVLFRPPYGGDVEPTTGREVSPMLMAADLHYVTVGETNDPQDYRLYDFQPGSDTELDLTHPRSYESIVQSIVNNRDAGSVVLLHDAGGPRANTVAALPVVIEKLRSLGYKFVTAGEIRYPGQYNKVTPAQLRLALMPPLTGRDEVLAGADRYVFAVSYVVQRTLSTLFLLSLILGVSRVALFVMFALIQRFRERKRIFVNDFSPFVSVIVAAFNEEKVVNRTIQAILDGDYKNLEIVVVDDGSVDRTFDVVSAAYADDARVTALRKPNGGKASALNVGMVRAKGEVLVALDADTLFARDTISKLVRHFADPRVGAVSGNVRVGNVNNIWTKWQGLEYITSQNFDRRAYDLLNCITVVPGAVGALRREAVISVGGYTPDTLAEDTDLTWKLRRAEWRIVNDNTAMAYTEAPENLSALARQRFRWAFGTLQCLWKHRPALFQHGAFGWVALPSLWLYQILFPAISPFMDVYLIYSIFTGNGVRVGMFYLAMFGIELMAAVVATIMDWSGGKLLPWLFFQKFLYRQLMYYVILKSIISAFRGSSVGWGKLERTGTARVGAS